MQSSISILVITTQTWLHVTRLALRLSWYGCKISVLCPSESHLAYLPGVHQRFSYSVGGRVRSIRNAIEKSGADFILPADDLAVWALHEVMEQHPSLAPLVERSLGNPRFQPFVRSRFELLALAHRLGIAVPETELIHQPSDLNSWSESGETSFIMKKDGTWGGSGVRVVRTAEEAQQVYARLLEPESLSSKLLCLLRNGDYAAFSKLRCLPEPEITAQAMIAGVPANSMYVCDRGRILGEVQARVVVTKGKTGPSLVIQLMNDRRITRAARLLARELELSGCFGLDFMIDGRGEPLLIELNPRFTQLGPLAVAGQPDLAGLLYAHWTGAPVPEPGHPDLEASVSFYPEGERWTREAASFPGCRIDLFPSEADMFAAVAKGDPRWHMRLRRRLWNSLSNLKGTLQMDQQWQPFFYQDVARRDAPGEELVLVGGKKSDAISFAS
ncbi:ATP-grasp domain-containing protein [Acidipila sp. EB88]|uniref:ATP-grasp domain-containing protein n=1 Tax=Acidipila sp. EB88 TaxID=2305226 RepID=UPI000F5F7700|nr:ATP-grasp domain-containing protein [Acidipila sp. EB88]RRA47487.1 ATP-grasp domain-containing protein [Acidipila sp. EB88]